MHIDISVYQDHSRAEPSIMIETELFRLRTDCYRDSVQHTEWELYPIVDEDDDEEDYWVREIRGSYEHALGVLCTFLYTQLSGVDLNRSPQCTRDDRCIPAEWRVYTTLQALGQRPSRYPGASDHKHPSSQRLNAVWRDMFRQVRRAISMEAEQSYSREARFGRPAPRQPEPRPPAPPEPTTYSFDGQGQIYLVRENYWYDGPCLGVVAHSSAISTTQMAPTWFCFAWPFTLPLLPERATGQGARRSDAVDLLVGAMEGRPRLTKGGRNKNLAKSVWNKAVADEEWSVEDCCLPPYAPEPLYPRARFVAVSGRRKFGVYDREKGLCRVSKSHGGPIYTGHHFVHTKASEARRVAKALNRRASSV